MNWREATIQALTRMSLRHRRNVFTRSQVIQEELQQISNDVATAGRTPAQTLSRVLQELRDEGYLEFDGLGRYKLLSSSSQPVASDIPSQYQTPARAPATIHRVIRDVGIVGELKRLYGYRCQICETRLELSSGFYCEAHHLKPLGTPHNGPDTKTNMLIVCPNHHVLLDYGALKITVISLRLNSHNLDPDLFNYHNKSICDSAEQTAPLDRRKAPIW
jgi:predicted restriction endonuclease